MRIFITSDLHIDQRDRNEITRLASWLENLAKKDDYLILAGDYANSLLGISECIKQFDRFPGQKAAIAGNHDLWAAKGEWLAQERLDFLQQLFTERGFHPLEKSPLFIGDLAVVGAMGWYDYSFRDETLGIPLSFYQNKWHPELNVGWNDRTYCHWSGKSDLEITSKQLDILKNHLDSVANAKKILVVTHHLTQKRLLFHPRWLISKKWRFLNAFLGSQQFGDLFEQYPAIKNVVSGHVHTSKTFHSKTCRYDTIGTTYTKFEIIELSEQGVIRHQL